jgi:uncharacterized protein (TIGR02266 family)
MEYPSPRREGDPMSDSSNERRVHPRLPICLPVQYKSTSDFYVDYALDISHGGMFVATEEKIEVGTPISVRFAIPEMEYPFEASGVVVRTAVKPNEGVGIRFDPLSKNARDIIEQLWQSKIRE